MDCELSKESLRFLSSWLGQDEVSARGTADRSPLETASEIVHDYDVYATVARIIAAANASEYKVALQFPDELLHHAPLVCEALRVCTEEAPNRGGNKAEATNFFYFILGDTSYGECCVDEVAAQHLSADLVVHYGGACLSPTRTLPVLYVFPKFRFQRPEAARANFKAAIENVLSRADIGRVVVMYDVELYSCFQKECFLFNDSSVSFDLATHGNELHFASLRLTKSDHIIEPGSETSATAAATAETKIRVGALAFDRSCVSMDRTAFLWFTRNPSLDEWPAAARNAALQLCTGPQETCAGFLGASLTAMTDTQPMLVDASRILRKRFAVLSKVKDAERIGIVPGTLGVSGNLEVIDRCKRIIKSAGKRSYVMLVGKPNPSKLANFAEINVFVLVACPQNALLDGRDYLQPIVTPLELEAALLSDGDIFSSPYSVDFRDLLERKLDLEDDIEESVDPNKEESTVALRGDWSVSVTGDGGAAEFLKSRHWQGLSYSTGGADDETDVGDLPLKATLGQTGIASKYDGEVKHSEANRQTS